MFFVVYNDNEGREDGASVFVSFSLILKHTFVLLTHCQLRDPCYRLMRSMNTKLFNAIALFDIF